MTKDGSELPATGQKLALYSADAPSSPVFLKFRDFAELCWFGPLDAQQLPRRAREDKDDDRDDVIRLIPRQGPGRREQQRGVGPDPAQTRQLR